MGNHNEDIFEIPEWIKKEDTQAPKMGRDAFINKSILSLLSVISKIKAQDTAKPSKHQINVFVRVIFTFTLVILISISSSFAFMSVINVYLLLILSAMEAKQIINILKISLIMTAFTFVILLPAAFWGNSYSLIMVPLKVFSTITAVNILSHSAKWREISNAFKIMWIPDIFILVLDITIKYIVLLAELALHMLYALKLRSVGFNDRKGTSLAGIGGTIFIKSKEMAEEMYSAMKCRGFTGEYIATKKIKITAADLIYIVINIAIIVFFIYSIRH